MRLAVFVDVFSAQSRSISAGQSSRTCDGSSDIAFGGGSALTGVLTSGRHELTIGFSQTGGLPVTLTLCSPEYDVAGPYQ